MAHLRPRAARTAPAASRGSGRCSAARSGTASGRSSDNRSSRSSRSRPAAEAPTVPVSASRSPGRASSRRRSWSGYASPSMATLTTSGPGLRTVSPPTISDPVRRASSLIPSYSSSTSAVWPGRRATETRPRPGRAPIAARSDRLTARAFQPRSRGEVQSSRKWIPSTSMSVVATTTDPAPGRHAAASSPIPSPSRGWSRRAERASMRSNSPGPLIDGPPPPPRPRPPRGLPRRRPGREPG